MTRPPGPDRPLYSRIAASLKGRILSGALPPGSRLPGEERLAASLGVSRSTLRQAIAALRDSGYVTSRTGSGSYVADVLPVQPLTPRSGPVYSGFLDDLDDEALHVDESHRSHRSVTADDALATALRVSEGAELVRYDAVRRRDGVVYGLASDVLPAWVAHDITPEILAASPTIGDAMATAGHRVMESLQRVEPALLDERTAELCGVAAGSPALTLAGTAYNNDRVPINCYRLIIVAGYGIGLALTRVNSGLLPAP
ncbi:GntR family transcriptional regulator [Phytoactinopolyspora limicola]|uniref:GntR family transcriptional regulator n=1 Tax=Phytoactinopolyspora limicola TaxID=2715536 RepID=UPI001409D9AA|nr:GntR family transcriptional regulator [Phytoactinopolyspora limicola]